MRLVKIAENEVTLELEPPDCFLLAQALYDCGLDEAGHDEPVQQTRGRFLLATAGLLEGAGMATAPWFWLRGKLGPEYDLDAMRADWAPPLPAREEGEAPPAA